MIQGAILPAHGGATGGHVAAYRQSAAQTGSPGERIVLLYEGAIRSLHAAGTAIAERRIEDRHREVRRAFAIVTGLQACLDFERGGEVAHLLDRFYGYVLTRLPQIDLQDDPAICSELAARLQEMRASWAAIARTPAPPPAATLPPGLGAA